MTPAHDHEPPKNTRWFWEPLFSRIEQLRRLQCVGQPSRCYGLEMPPCWYSPLALLSCVARSICQRWRSNIKLSINALRMINLWRTATLPCLAPPVCACFLALVLAPGTTPKIKENGARARLAPPNWGPDDMGINRISATSSTRRK